ncbi:DUF4097 family beta strand repeat-containing protein [Paenibacillus pinistramenti]|uniref:DUF4097 family beta strand repeat-containing protein n=1 Tax=Paenibacillus pinistramenti TaxID=1768003 RepID=UPI001109E1A0|nr:DUF4097 family beta strand repeat-containing protein [Paenibacillus pinistramenti]
MANYFSYKDGSKRKQKPQESASRRKSAGFMPRRRKLKLVSVLLAALLPGLGHLYLKLFGKGITLIYLILIDAASLVYFSSSRMHINVPLLILLVLLVPVIYFYSIYDVLQSTDYWNARRGRDTEGSRRSAGKSIRRGLGLGGLMIGGGLLLFLLRQQPEWFTLFIQNYGGYAVAVLFLAAAAVLTAGESRRRFKRTGRLTAAIFLAAVGVLLILDLYLNRDAMLLLLKWWPILLVALGCEAIFNILRGRNKGGTEGSPRIRMDLKGLLLTLAASVSVFAITQQDHYVQLWKKVSLDLTAASMEFSEEKGTAVVKMPLDLPLASETTKLAVDGVNGNITISRESVYDVQVQYKVYVDEADPVKAQEIAEQTGIEASSGQTLELAVKDKSYGDSGNRHPRVNMNIILPYNRSLTLKVATTNGNLLVKNLAADKASLETGNGKVEIRNVYGEMTAKTFNGDVAVSDIIGNVQAESEGGNLTAESIYGNLKLSTWVGDITVKSTGGDIDISTKNGNLDIDEAPNKLSAQTLNGQILLKSNVIGGDWNVYSAVGELHITLPEKADYTLEASSGYGGIETNLPFPVEDKTIKGTWGTGEYKVTLDGNSNVFIQKEAINSLNSRTDPE